MRSLRGRPGTRRPLSMKAHFPLILGAALSGCLPACEKAPAAQTKRSVENIPKPGQAGLVVENESTFIGKVSRVEIGNLRHPYMRWVVVLKVDKVISGPSPGDGFWFAIHSPSQEGIKVGQRQRIRARKMADGYEIISRMRLD